jgi:hypothetical protein
VKKKKKKKKKKLMPMPMRMGWVEVNAAKRKIKSGSMIEVRKDELEGAMDRVRADRSKAVEIEVWDVCDGADGADGGGQLAKLKKVVVFFDGRHRGARADVESE